MGYPQTHDYKDDLRDLGFTPLLDGLWLKVGQARGSAGWKLHVSATLVNAQDVLLAIGPILKDERVPFKVASSSATLAELNEGTFGITQIGKFATIYPLCGDSARRLATRLCKATESVEGPRIVSDLHLGGAVYTRYGAFAPTFRRNRLGQMERMQDDEATAYTVPFVPPEGIENPFEDWPASQLEVASDTPLREDGLHGPGVRLLKPLTVQPKGCVYLALDMTEQEMVEPVIVKTGRAHCMSDAFGRDIRDRLTHQAHLLQQLDDCRSTPGFRYLFDEGENRYLVMSYVEGRDIGDADPRPFHERERTERRSLLKDFCATARALSELHSKEVIHRDVSARNIRILPDGTAIFVDLEMACRMPLREPVFQTGTPGFMSPQQVLRESPDPSDDIYGLGCVFINLLTARDPRRLDIGTDSDERFSYMMNVLSGAPADLVDLCRDMTRHDRKMRPALADVIKRLDANLVTNAKRPAEDRRRQRPSVGQETLDSLLSQAANWIIHGGFRDPSTNLPLSLEVNETHNNGAHSQRSAYTLYRSASRGVAGTIYALSRLEPELRPQGSEAYVGNAADWLLAQLPTPDGQMPGLHYGEAGVAVCLSEAIASGMLEKGDWTEPYLHEALSGPVDWHDLTHGAAGQVMAPLICAGSMGMPSLESFANEPRDWLLEHQLEDGSWAAPKGGGIAEGTVHTGLAHGVAGCIHALAHHGRLTGASKSIEAAMRGEAWLTRQAISTESGVAWPISSNDTTRWTWWCHGQAGIAQAYMSLYLATDDNRFADRMREALAALPLSSPHANLSQCHGISHLVEICLAAGTLLDDIELLGAGHAQAERIIALGRFESETLRWHVENAVQPTADLMIGTAGVLHSLVQHKRLLAGKPRLSLPLDLL